MIFFSKKLCKGEYRLAKYEWKIETEMFGSLIFSFTSFLREKNFFRKFVSMRFKEHSLKDDQLSKQNVQFDTIGRKHMNEYEV